jgi:hypothetical protein
MPLVQLGLQAPVWLLQTWPAAHAVVLQLGAHVPLLQIFPAEQSAFFVQAPACAKHCPLLHTEPAPQSTLLTHCVQKAAPDGQAGAALGAGHRPLAGHVTVFTIQEPGVPPLAAPADRFGLWPEIQLLSSVLVCSKFGSGHDEAWPGAHC